MAVDIEVKNVLSESCICNFVCDVEEDVEQIEARDKGRLQVNIFHD